VVAEAHALTVFGFAAVYIALYTKCFPTIFSDGPCP
jgi:hypothetical protein